MPDLMPRYLTAFHAKRLPHRFVDVLIIGGGLAGLRAAIEIDRSLSVLVVTKDQLRQSNSIFAQGGIAGVIDPLDRFEDHIADTISAGGGLCDSEVVEMVVREAPQRIQELIDWGTKFDQDAGELALGREGGHSHHRIVHAEGDSTGREVMRAVIDWTARLPHVTTWENSFTLDLLTDDEGCRGAIVARGAAGLTMVWAKQTILCTGGAGQLYRETSNPEVATGDGLGMAWRAGAELRDMEFMQFHCQPSHCVANGKDAALVRLSGYDAPGTGPRSQPVSRIGAGLREVWFGHHDRPHTRAAGCALLHGGREHRSRGAHVAAELVGRRRSDRQWAARREPIGEQ